MKTTQSSGFDAGTAHFVDRGVIAVTVLAASIAWVLWDFYALSRDQGSLAVELNIAMGWFLVLAGGYLGLHGTKNMAWISAPSLLTLRAILECVVFPAWLFMTGAVQVDDIYVHAMMLVLIGFICFWLASLLTLGPKRIQFAPQTQSTSPRVVRACVLLFAVGLSGTVIEWRLGLLGVLPQLSPLHVVNPYAGSLGYLSQLLSAALLIAATERFAKRSTSFAIHAVFWLALLTLLASGVVSGMKGLILSPILIVFVVYGVARRRFPRSVLLLPFSLIVILPFNGAYRRALVGGYGSRANTVSGLQAALGDAVMSTEGALAEGQQGRQTMSITSNRLSVLGYVHDIIGLPSPSLLNGPEKLWMAPFYPFIPRFLWKNKPVLNKGIRLSVALGRPNTTSSAVTPIGDLYTLYGSSGVAIGMFVYGIAMQLFMNVMVRGELTERGLFFYLSVIPSMINLESDVISLIAGTIQIMLVMLIVTRVIYGPDIPFWRRSTGEPELRLCES